MPEDFTSISAVKLALAARRLRDRMEGTDLLEAEPIAVTGMGCRFPGGANDPKSFWRLLENGVDAITEVPASRWDAAKLYDADRNAPGRMNTRYGGFLERIDLFDCGFFGISPREAACMDPQQRLLLQVVWEALEAGGHAVASLAGSRTGAFIGVCTSDYANLQLSDSESIDIYASTGSASSIIANRLSYFLDLRGPSMAIDTACSSSLVAVHLACQSLRRHECDLTIAGGVNLILSPGWTISFSKFGMMAPDGRCKAFDARADGFVRGEGVGAVTLRRLSDAIASGDPILAVIRGSAVNQDGQSNGLTAPNLLAQQAVIREALASAHVAPQSISYVEAHGTGTALGDPIEVGALAEVIGSASLTATPCALGSVKTNIGHLEAAAGIAGLIKVVLALQHGSVPPNLHFERLNPYISLEGTRFVIPTVPIPWRNGKTSRFAAVSSFGFGGTNAHVVLEEAPPVSTGAVNEPADTVRRLLPLSARSAEALESRARMFIDFLMSAPGEDVTLRDICFTASVRRHHLSHRLCVTGSSRDEMIEGLSARIRNRDAFASASLARPRIAFIYSGQGADWNGVGREMVKEAAFRRAMEECDALLRVHAGWSALEELTAPLDRTRLSDGRYAQPMLFCFQVALTAQWRAWGIEPDAVAGHSVGEAAAAFAAGALTLQEALHVVLERSRLMQQAAGKGAMAAVDLSAEEAERLVEGWNGRLWAAVFNGPLATVLSGEPAALEEALTLLEERKIFFRRLPVDFAFHTPQMEPFRAPLVRALSGIRPKSAAVPIASSVLARKVGGHELDAEYWGRNLREPVRFADAIDVLLAEEIGLFLEIAPQAVLGRALRQCADRVRPETHVLASLHRGAPERESLLETLGALFMRGCSPDWNAFFPQRGRTVPLPSYPWREESYWLVPGDAVSAPASDRKSRQSDAGHPLLGRRLDLAHLPNDHVWEIDLDSGRASYLREHRVRGAAVFPAAAYIEIALAAAGEVFGRQYAKLAELDLHKALVLPEDEVRTLQVRLTTRSSGGSVQIHSRGVKSPAWLLHASASFVAQAAKAGGVA